MALTVTLRDDPSGNIDAIAQAINRVRRELGDVQEAYFEVRLTS